MSPPVGDSVFASAGTPAVCVSPPAGDSVFVGVHRGGDGDRNYNYFVRDNSVMRGIDGELEDKRKKRKKRGW